MSSGHLGVAEAEDLAAMAIFLASPAARRITGQAISINGAISVAYRPSTRRLKRARAPIDRRI
jgi:NAD(P)-dependent dehydrogenase (short-subunit alcohol dehydrogenase family)